MREGGRSKAAVRRSSSAKDGSPARSARTTRVFTKNPTSASTASSPRPATGLPSGMSSPAPSRCNSAATAAVTTVYIVVPRSPASASSRATSSYGTGTDTVRPSCVGRAGRGRSTGSGSSCGSPARASRQNPA